MFYTCAVFSLTRNLSKKLIFLKNLPSLWALGFQHEFLGEMREWLGELPGKDYGWRFGGEKFQKTPIVSEGEKGCTEQTFLSNIIWKHLLSLTSTN